jgi:hypothetical protein
VDSQGAITDKGRNSLLVGGVTFFKIQKTVTLDNIEMVERWRARRQNV